MISFHAPIDSYTSAIAAHSDAEYPSVHYPPYTELYLHDLLAHFVTASHGNPVGVLPSLNESGLHALTAAIVKRNDPNVSSPEFVAALLAEIRWRGCRTMGGDPTGPVRRGRLIQTVSTFTPLNTLGASPLQRDQLAGQCPFCGENVFRVSLASVRWRCFACQREGGLLEFAEGLLEQVRSPAQPDGESAATSARSTNDTRRTP